ncbi:MAG: hypothetical protein R3Y64_09585 [Peptostreptococcaceae bacterium]
MDLDVFLITEYLWDDSPSYSPVYTEVICNIYEEEKEDDSNSKCNFWF